MWARVRRLLYWDRACDPVAAYEAELERLLAVPAGEEDGVGSNANGEAMDALLARELVFECPTTADVIATFRMRYDALCAVRFSRLTPPPACYAEYEAYVRRSGLGLEDYADDALFGHAALLQQMERLHAALANADAAATVAVSRVVASALLSCCLVPVALVAVRGKHDVLLHYDYTGGVRRHWIQGLPAELVCEVVKELRFFAAQRLGALDTSILLSHCEWERFEALSVEQRVANLALCNVAASPLRRRMADSELVRAVLASDRLLQWMLTCSHMDEQYWLNTCEVAARNNAICARLPTVAHCMVFTQAIVDDLRATKLPTLSKTQPWARSAWRCDLPSVAAYCAAVLDQADADLAALVAHCHALLARGSPLDALCGVVHEWHRITQQLAGIFYPAEPVVLTRKLFSENWQLSAKVISVACIATTLLPTQPLVWLRNEGAVGEYPPSAAWFLWRDKLSPSQFPQWAKLHTSLALMDDEAALRVLNELWEVTLRYGGVYFASKEHIWGVEVGHLNVLYAVRLHTAGRQFLIGDPEIGAFKWLSVAQLRAVIVDPRVQFDLFDV